MKKIKNKGVVILVPTIILSGLILVVSLGLSQVLMTELEFSADLLFSEKAYFAAESGVEKSLLTLKNEPLNYVDTNLWDSEDLVSLKVGTGATYDLNIANSVKIFSFNLAKDETIKFQLGIDSDSSFEADDIIPVTSFEVGKLNEDSGFLVGTLNEGALTDLQWKILCSRLENDNRKKTIALYGTGENFDEGTYDDGDTMPYDKAVTTFLLGNNKRNSICFMSLTNSPKTDDVNSGDNFAESVISGVFRPTSGEPARIADAKVKITATGRSFSREKIVTFDYFQKNLSSIFDLGLYFTGE